MADRRTAEQADRRARLPRADDRDELSTVPAPDVEVEQHEVDLFDAAYVWDHAGEMQLIRYFWHAAVALIRPLRRSTRRGGFHFATASGCSPCSGIAASIERSVSARCAHGIQGFR